MLDRGEISTMLLPLDHDQVQPASIDLRLGDYAYPVDTSFLPGKGMKVLDKMKQLDDRIENFRIDLRDGAVLEKGRVYVIPLLEVINLRSEVAAFANPKSSTGRLDILTRLIADGATTFDQVGEGYKGELYIEVAPRSFSVVVKTGTRLNQLRFRRTRGEKPKSITSADCNSLACQKFTSLSRGWAMLAHVLPNTTGTGSAVERQVSTDSSLRAIKRATCHASVCYGKPPNIVNLRRLQPSLAHRQHTAI